MEKSARTYTITERTLDKVKAEIMEQFRKYGMKVLAAKNKAEMSSSITGFIEVAIGASIFCKLAPDDYPIEELIVCIITADALGD